MRVYARLRVSYSFDFPFSHFEQPGIRFSPKYVKQLSICLSRQSTFLLARKVFVRYWNEHGLLPHSRGRASPRSTALQEYARHLLYPVPYQSLLQMIYHPQLEGVGSKTILTHKHRGRRISSISSIDSDLEAFSHYPADGSS